VSHEAGPIGLSGKSRKALYFKANKPGLPSGLRHFLNMQIPPGQYPEQLFARYFEQTWGE
jgi:hypothetical protein